MVIRRGPNYVVYETDEQEVKKAWLYDLVESTKEKLNAINQTNQSAKQISESSNLTSATVEELQSTTDQDTDELDRLLADLDEDTKAERPKISKNENETVNQFIEELELEFSLPKGRTYDWIRAKTVDRKQINHGINTFKSKMSTAKNKFTLAADIAQKLGIGLREFQSALQAIKLLPEETESYEIGTIEYAKHAFELTPGQNIKNYRKTTKQISKEDVEKWADEEGTIDKYKERYKRSWKTELKKTVERMLDEI
jgi:vacuolar-type H+-ATPase subunit I/STV1